MSIFFSTCEETADFAERNCNFWGPARPVLGRTVPKSVDAIIAGEKIVGGAKTAGGTIDEEGFDVQTVAEAAPKERLFVVSIKVDDKSSFLPTAIGGLLSKTLF